MSYFQPIPNTDRVAQDHTTGQFQLALFVLTPEQHGLFQAYNSRVGATRVKKGRSVERIYFFEPFPLTEVEEEKALAEKREKGKLEVTKRNFQNDVTGHVSILCMSRTPMSYMLYIYDFF